MHGPRRSLLGLGLGLVLAACGPGGPSPGAETRTEAEAGDELGESGAGEEAGESESGETGEAESCGDLWIVPAYVPPLLMLVVDESESMLAPWDHDGDPETPTQPRWHGARAVVELLGEIAGDKAVVGLRAFPGADACPEATAMSPSCADASACSIAAAPELSPAEGNGPALLDAIPGLDPDPILLAGASPAAAATEAAVDELVSVRAARYPGSPAYLRPDLRGLQGRRRRVPRDLRLPLRAVDSETTTEKAPHSSTAGIGDQSGSGRQRRHDPLNCWGWPELP